MLAPKLCVSVGLNLCPIGFCQNPPYVRRKSSIAATQSPSSSCDVPLHSPLTPQSQFTCPSTHMYHIYTPTDRMLHEFFRRSIMRNVLSWRTIGHSSPKLLINRSYPNGKGIIICDYVALLLILVFYFGHIIGTTHNVILRTN